MGRLLHILAFSLLAVFVASTVVHAAATTEMSVRMTVAATDADMGDCDGCDDRGSALADCDQVCVQSLAALPLSGSADTARTPASRRLSVPQDLAGFTGPPERHPPR